MAKGNPLGERGILDATLPRWFRSALLAILALAVISGGSFAAGDLFDDDYSDCPVRTRLRDGQIAGLSVLRDSDEEDEVNVSWSATDPASWGLGPNTYSTTLVVILDDGNGDPLAKTLSLGTRKTTFDSVKTGTEVTVQMAIVTDTADGGYLISDILETSVNQSLTEPAFGGRWHQLVEGPPDPNGLTNSNDFTRDADPDKVGHQYDTEEIGGGLMYYIGYNENFANYRKGTAVYTHKPSTPRLRIGLAHSANETDGEREDVDFDAYVLRIVDADGDVVNEGDDVATIETNYGLGPDGSGENAPQETLNKLFVHDLKYPYYPTFSAKGTIIIVNDSGTRYAPDYETDFVPMAGLHEDTGIVLTNVRIVDGSKVNVGMHRLPNSVLAREDTNMNIKVTPTSNSIVKVGTTGNGHIEYRDPGQVFANPPDEHRDFPVDTLKSDETYTITAWAVNEDDEVISPVATLKLRPIDRTVTLSETTKFRDYLNPEPEAVDTGTLIVTEFTVLK